MQERAIISVTNEGADAVLATPAGVAESQQLRRRPNMQENTTPLSTSTKSIPLPDGRFARVDAEDFELVSQHKWRVLMTGRREYVATSGKDSKGKFRKTLYIHRLILDPPSDMCVDHINGDTLDNRRENLRLATYAENARNCALYKNNKSGYKGVRRAGKHWMVEVQYRGAKLTAHGFSDVESAALFYDELTAKLFGQFARPNIARGESEHPIMYVNGRLF